MKFMLVSDTFPPDINGVARTLQTLSRGLAKRGHEVHVITTSEGARDENKKYGVKVQAVGAMPLPGYDGVRLGFASRNYFARHIESLRPDAMYVAVETIMGCNAIRAAKLHGVRVVSGFHTNFHTYSQDYRVPILKNAASGYLRWLHNCTARTLTPSESTAAQLRKLGIDNVGVLGRGVDTDLFNPDRRDESLRRSWGVDGSTPVALFVGRVAAEKNLPLTVKAFQRIQAKHPGAKCVFVGDGPKAASLMEAHPEFIFAGARRGEDLASHYASADIFVFPSLTETFGNVLTEALASGLSTVSFDYAAANQHVRHGDNGHTAAFGDESAFLAATDAALAHWQDVDLRNAAARTAEKLSWNAIVEQFEQELAGTAFAFAS
ncbi:glycosyltransferase family 1 protein [Roseimicrobium sp. ORNL1]|uniref:glycosyltransferase family 4 protein n=1 Tax=Roseimicrobium sp. ORNL1 TaxID=2711231 RepID=UPI0013E18ADB|nr:glycosyltransferase family 1 protein [Roseimicrobium sp. ORNL1]QIF04715.1 glycosyltransferase family 1 protein [Roseimicrobium sp. ORNL1]